MATRQAYQRRAVSLFELLVAITIVAVLVSIAIMSVQVVRESSRRAACQNNHRQIGLAITGFESRNQYIPRHVGRMAWLVHWQYEILPEIEQVGLYDAVQSEMSNRADWHALTGYRTRIPLYECPSDRNAGFSVHQHYGYTMAVTNYPGIVGQSLEENDGVFPSVHGGISWPFYKKLRFSDVSDGLSNTLAVCERAIADLPVAGAWQSSQEYGSDAIGLYDSIDLRSAGPRFSNCPFVIFSQGASAVQCDQYHPWSYHNQGANFALLDGSVRWIGYGADKYLLRSMCSRAKADYVVGLLD